MGEGEPRARDGELRVGDDWSQMMKIVSKGLEPARQGVTVVELRIGDDEVRVGDGQVMYSRR